MGISVISRVDGLSRKAVPRVHLLLWKVEVQMLSIFTGTANRMPLHLEHVTVGDSLMEAQLSSVNNLGFLMAF